MSDHTTSAGPSGGSSIPALTLVCATVIVASATLVLIGWGANVDPLRYLFISSVAVRPNAAITLALAAMAMLLPRRWSRVAAAVVVLIGGGTVLEYVLGRDLGIDNLAFFATPARETGAFPLRMAPQAALAALLSGLALLASHGGRGARRTSHALAMLTTWISLLALVAVIYDGRIFLSLPRLTQMSWTLATLFLIWSLGFLARTTAEGPAALFVSRDRWGGAVRRIAGAAIVVPFMFGLVCLRLVEQRWIDARFAIAGATSATTLTLIFIIVTYTNRVREEDVRRGAAEDATRRTQALYRTIVETALEGVCIADASGRLTFVNGRLAEMVAVPRNELLGRNLFDFVLEVRGTESYQDSPLGAKQEVRMQSADGRDLDILCSSTGFQRADGTFDGVVAMLVDTTEREAARRALETAHDLLRQRVHALEGVQLATQTNLRRAHDSLEDLAARLTTAHLELESFSYSVSHDLRAPLRGIDGFSRELLRSTRLEDRERHFVQRIHAAAQRMSALIDSLLDLSRVSHAHVRRETVDVSALATSVAHELRDRISSPAVIDVQPGLHSSADPHLLRIALENLIGNALKFSSRRDEPRVEIGAGPDGAFFVRDNGIGFDPAHAEKLFSPFERLQNEFEGSGIGLAIVHRIIRRHGGGIRAESRPGEGTTISFTLHDHAQANGEAA